MANKKTTFGQDIERLGEIVRLLEEGSKSLEESISLYEEGNELVKRCGEKLNAAKLTIEQLEKENAQ